jgi:hypothetical protein
MPRPRTKTVGGVLYLTIWVYPDSAKGTCTFNGDAKYVTDTGNVILFKAAAKVHITMVIPTPTGGYKFDAANSIVISENLAHKGQPGYRPSNFTPPVLTGNTQIEFDDDNHGNKHFYYTLNFIDPNGNPFSFDPIIVNN